MVQVFAPLHSDIQLLTIPLQLETMVIQGYSVVCRTIPLSTIALLGEVVVIVHLPLLEHSDQVEQLPIVLARGLIADSVREDLDKFSTLIYKLEYND